MLGALALVSTTLHSSLRSVHETGTYEAGIPASHHHSGSLPESAYSVVWFLLLHELLLLWMVPSVQDQPYARSAVTMVFGTVVCNH